MLVSDTNCLSDIILGVEPLIPLGVGEVFLLESIECNLLLIDCCKGILIFRLRQNSLLNQPHQGERIVGGTDRSPIGVLLHLILQELGTLP